MRPFVTVLSQRAREIDKHLSFVIELHDMAVGRVQSYGRPIDLEHIHILKSGFLVHLYNVVEAVMSQVLEEIGRDIPKHPSTAWRDEIFAAWVKERTEPVPTKTPDQRVREMVKILSELSGRSQMTRLSWKVDRGNWSHKEIENLAKRLSCNITIPADVFYEACKRNFVDNKPPVEYVRHMRNQLTHGNLSFFEASAALDPTQLSRLRGAVMGYMVAITGAFSAYLDSAHFLRGQNP